MTSRMAAGTPIRNVIAAVLALGSGMIGLAPTYAEICVGDAEN